MRNIIIFIIGIMFASTVSNLSMAAPVVWTGPKKVFIKADFADWTDSANQDRITDKVIITRKDSMGIFNIAAEPGYDLGSSPADTEWATGSAADYSTLMFTDWKTWRGSPQDALLFVDAVVHLISEDIYIDITFLQWTIGRGNGGGFAYERSTVPLPSSLLLLVSAIIGLAGLRRRYIPNRRSRK